MVWEFSRLLSHLFSLHREQPDPLVSWAVRSLIYPCRYILEEQELTQYLLKLLSRKIQFYVLSSCTTDLFYSSAEQKFVFVWYLFPWDMLSVQVIENLSRKVPQKLVFSLIYIKIHHLRISRALSERKPEYRESETALLQGDSNFKIWIFLCETKFLFEKTALSWLFETNS